MREPSYPHNTLTPNKYQNLVYASQVNGALRARWLANSEVISQVLFTSEMPKKNKNGFPFQIKLLLNRRKVTLWSAKYSACVVCTKTISIGNSTVSRGIWDKYREWYFKIHQNITSRRGEWYLGSFEISRAGIYPKYPEETVLFFVYTTRQRNFAFHITHEHIFLFSHAQLIGFTTTCDWL